MAILGPNVASGIVIALCHQRINGINDKVLKDMDNNDFS
jgi:hypothetical protein